MPANSPEEICSLFQQSMAAGDIDGVLSLYDPEAVILDESGEVKKGEEGLKQNLAPLATAKARFDFTVKQVIQTGDIALMHTKWNVSGPQTMTVHAIEVARRQPNGTWRWLIGDPFTIGKTIAADSAAKTAH
jgi:ketosteroid isomerase-like protein